MGLRLALHSLIGAGAAALLLASAPAHAQLGGTEATAVKEGFVLPAGPTRILVFRPDVRVGEQTTRGMNEPRVAWTMMARDNILAALRRQQAARGSELVLVGELAGEQAELAADYTALFKAVADAAFNHKLFPGNRLPSKRDRFDWTLGAGAARLRQLGGDYGLFLYTYDSYGSTGRKVAQALGLLLGGGLLPSGVHVGYAGLVDFDSGDLVWLNADVQMGGDVRDSAGAEKRVAQLLEGFPGRGVAGPPAHPASAGSASRVERTAGAPQDATDPR
jgi:hypothetical protein